MTSRNRTTENAKIAIILRVGRAALGISQADFAELLGIAKSTLARAETVVAPLKTDSYLKALKFFKEGGVQIDMLASDDIEIAVTPVAMQNELKSAEEREALNLERLRIHGKALRALAAEKDDPADSEG